MFCSFPAAPAVPFRLRPQRGGTGFRAHAAFDPNPRIRSRAQLSLPRGEVAWLEDVDSLVASELDAASFLLTEDGLEITYPAMRLSDWIYGAQSFLIPYEILEDLFRL